VRDTVVLSRIRSSICKKGKGGCFFFSFFSFDFNPKSKSLKQIFRHINVDYSVCKALNFNSSGLPEGLVIYDVMCQYLVHFEERIEEVSDHLELDPDLKIFGAVGKFHLSDHVDTCFCKWSLNYMKGSGHIDGEIMETLWSGMNKISAAARTMSKSHRQEVLDDYMRDSNWKKTVGIGEFFLSFKDDFHYCVIFTQSQLSLPSSNVV
jgi:hypothetical protein